MINEIIWIVLAGGQAKRMNKQDKGLIELNNIPLIEHVLGKLKAQGAKVAINANRNIDKYQEYAEVFHDLSPHFLGPLAGMQAAMKTYHANWFGFVPCDTPNLPNDLVKNMQFAITPRAEILVAHDGKDIQPTVCMIKKSTLPKLEHFLNQGERKLRLFHSQCHTQTVDFSHQPSAFINLNTPKELKDFEHRQATLRVSNTF